MCAWRRELCYTLHTVLVQNVHGVCISSPRTYWSILRVEHVRSVCICRRVRIYTQPHLYIFLSSSPVIKKKKKNLSTLAQHIPSHITYKEKKTYISIITYLHVNKYVLLPVQWYERERKKNKNNTNLNAFCTSVIK